MLFLLTLVAIAARTDRVTSAVAALFSVAAFDLFCVPPYGLFVVADSEYVVTFVAMVAVALVISSSAERLRRHADDAEAREARARIVHKLAERLADETRVFEVARAAAEAASKALQSPVVIFLRDGERLSFERRTSDHLPVPSSEVTIAEWAFQKGRKAGRGVDGLLEAKALYVPLRGTRATVGVMAVLPGEAETSEREILIDLLANQTALAMERTISQQSADTSREKMQTEQMRSSLLSAVSHDLLTPLASITGAVSTLRHQGERIPEETRKDLLEGISSEAERLSRLVRNLLDMTRFEMGGMELRKDAYPLEEILGTALHRLDAALKGREVKVALPESLPLIYGDEVLLGQVFLNLLENTLKYTPEGTGIEIAAREAGQNVEVTVRDHGPGLPAGQEEYLFDKFYRGRSGGSGSGLGLAIAKAIVEAHGGRIAASNHPQGGALFWFRLPAHAKPPEPAQ